MSNLTSLYSSPVIKKLDKKLEPIFKNMPHLPKTLVKIVVKIIPYLILISGLFLIIRGFSTIFNARASHQLINSWYGTAHVYLYLIGLLQILVGSIYLIAYQPLKNRKFNGWLILFDLSFLELIVNLCSALLVGAGLLGSLLNLFISLYVLYEIKSAYSPLQSLINKTTEITTLVKKEVKNKTKKLTKKVKK
jgi:hypothetical protein